MDLLEWRGKEVLEAAGLPVPRGRRVDIVSEVQATIEDVGLPAVVKAQVPIGGRGRAGGVRVCRTRAELEEGVRDILGMEIRGHVARSVLVEEAVDVARELYVAIALSRAHRAPLLLFSRQGGMAIEQVARSDPAALLRLPIDPLLGLHDYQVRELIAAAGLEAGAETPRGRPLGAELAAIVRGLHGVYEDRDALLVEVNPLVITTDSAVVCLDCKISLDENAWYRQPDMRAALEAGDEDERRARQAGLSYVPLDGTIGVLGNGAGLVMSTIDQIAAAGGRAADFCDVGGGATAGSVASAIEAILSSHDIGALAINIFGGITRCDEVARGLVEALSAAQLSMPIFVRLEGTAVSEARDLLAEAGVRGLIVVATVAELVEGACSATACSGATAAAERGHDGDPR